eukprot:TRINITY_DN22228_c0_g1_i2.p1 TRINITY_DN22228_c0_g1~~TRINITY_DN22228_c0_g1_i2.p1  ORF type:complete len:434 (-),score=81.89 TRINITY_DN22228_c0_g1_i2:118-1323(-)
MSRRPSQESQGSISSLPSTPISVSHSTCASVTDLLPSTFSTVTTSTATAATATSSLLTRAAAARTQLGNGAGVSAVVRRSGEPAAVATEIRPEILHSVMAFYGTASADVIERRLQMSSDAFTSLCRDSGLIDEKLATHVNLIFARVTRPEFVMNSEQLATALVLIAKRKGCPMEDVSEALNHVVLRRSNGGSDSAALSIINADMVSDEFFQACQRNQREDQMGASASGSTSADQLSLLEAELSTDRGAVLLKTQYLLQLSQSGGVLPRRCDLPAKAIWKPQELMRRGSKKERLNSRNVVLAAVSCFWQSIEHPDPKGQQLKALCQFIERRLEKRQVVNKPVEEIAIFWDYASLNQEDKNVSQRALELGLMKRDLWFSNPHVEVWILNEDSPDTFSCSKSSC